MRDKGLIKSLSAALLILSWTGTASPADLSPEAIQFASAGRLLTACETYLKVGTRVADGASCFDRMWSTVATITSLELLRETLGKADRVICLPEAFSVDQATRVFVKYAGAHPENLHIKAELLFIAAVGEVFPCPG